LRPFFAGIFVATQGVLLIAWANKPTRVVPAFALIACLSTWLWDSRNRHVIEQVHRWGREIADKFMFATDSEGMPCDGVHVHFSKTMSASGRLWPGLSGFMSHTWAIRVLLIGATALWLWLLFNR
jgi:hypothetical protein